MQGCPSHVLLVQCAARSGNLACLQHVVEDQGLYMDEAVLIVAVLKGDLNCVQYLLDQGCPFINGKCSDHAEDWNTYDGIFRKDNPNFVLCVEYAVERGWVPDENFIDYIVTRDEPCKQWLISEGYYREYLF